MEAGAQFHSFLGRILVVPFIQVISIIFRIIKKHFSFQSKGLYQAHADTIDVHLSLDDFFGPHVDSLSSQQQKV
jgi:hypothetical protein